MVSVAGDSRRPLGPVHPLLPLPPPRQPKKEVLKDENGIPVHYSEATYWLAMAGIVMGLCGFLYGTAMMFYGS